MNAVTASILIWHYYSKKIFPGEKTSESQVSAYQTLKQNNLIKGTEEKGISITSRGIFLVKYWINTPIPVSKEIWTINRND